MKRKRVVPKDKMQLQNIIHKEIKTKGECCDLNFIDVSSMTDMSYLFSNSNFNGDISKWDMSNVESMHGMFSNSKFNGDISNWDTSQVKFMTEVFYHSDFDGDISKWNTQNVLSMGAMFLLSNFNGDISMWNVEKVVNMSRMFYNAKFVQDLDDWKPYSLEKADNFSKNINPYWLEYQSCDTRKSAIEKYVMQKKLKDKLVYELEHKQSNTIKYKL